MMGLLWLRNPWAESTKSETVSSGSTKWWLVTQKNFKKRRNSYLEVRFVHSHLYDQVDHVLQVDQQIHQVLLVQVIQRIHQGLLDLLDRAILQDNQNFIFS